MQSNYKDEPYVYHAKIIDILATCTIGKEGLYLSESKLRQVFSLKYLFELLGAPDSYSDAPQDLSVF